MKFSDYNISSLIKSQLETLGFNRPTDIQFKAIKPILDGEDVLAIAQTGTGKTGAFAIPVMAFLGAMVKLRMEFDKAQNAAMDLTEATGTCICNSNFTRSRNKKEKNVQGCPLFGDGANKRIGETNILGISRYWQKHFCKDIWTIWRRGARTTDQNVEQWN